ncbi:DciA family protein [Imhoffiella purpurea]|nr:DciA family protein [Imhoffiella purpurea]
MPATRLAHVQDLLNKHATFRTLVAQRRREIELLEEVRARLPPPLREHCLDASLVEDCLTLFLDSAVWATRVRFLAADIVESLNSPRIARIRTRIRVGRGSTPEGRGDSDRTRGLTSGAARHLLEAAEHMSDPSLRETFRRFALRHVEHTATDEV